MRRARNQLPPEFATVHAAVCKPKSWWEERRRQYMEDDRVRFGLTITGKHDEASSVIAYRDEGEVEATHSGLEDGSSSSISQSAATPHSASSPPKSSSSPITSGLVVDTENRYPKTEDGLHDDLDEQVSNTSMSDDGLDADGMDHQSVATTATAATTTTSHVQLARPPNSHPSGTRVRGRTLVCAVDGWADSEWAPRWCWTTTQCAR